MLNSFSTLTPDSIAPSPHGDCDKPFGLGLFTMEHYKNLSLSNIIGEIGGVVYIEEWKDVIGYEGIYKISTFGRVKTMERVTPQGKKVKTKILKQGSDKDGYKQILLCKDGKITNGRIHRLMCVAFLGKNIEKPIVNHKDGIKWNNFYNNLEWCTVKENTIHSYKSGLQTPSPKLKGGDNNRSKTVIRTYPDGTVNIFKGVKNTARLTGINAASIWVANRDNKKTKDGCTWKII